jgi:hypothetical protein
MERILCSAIWYPDLELVKDIKHNRNPVNVDRGAVFCGYRHPHCMYTMCAVTGKRSVSSVVGKIIQGFLTSENRFVDRKEALEIARNANQLKPDEPIKTSGLYSENLY